MSQEFPKEGYIHHPEKGPLHYIDWGGKGPYAHLLHANGFCAGTYDPLIRKMLTNLRIIGSDIRGHGNSLSLVEMPIKHWKIFSDDLLFILSSMGLSPVIGMGHSLGAVTTLITAASCPDLFRCIILMDPVILPRLHLLFMQLLRQIGLIKYFPLAKQARRRKFVFNGKQEALARFSAGRGIFKTWDPDFVNAYLECGLLTADEETAILKCDPELEAQIFESVPADIWLYVKQVRCPVLLIRGKQSDTFLQSAAERTVRTMADCELKVVDNAGHFVPMEQPDICADIILDFIKRKANA